MKKEILEFISRRFKIDANWLNGNCYWFAYILISRFPSLKIYYEPVIGHFVAGDGENFYDWTGEVHYTNLISLYEIEKEDPLWYGRLIRDCVN